MEKKYNNRMSASGKRALIAAGLVLATIAAHAQGATKFTPVTPTATEEYITTMPKAPQDFCANEFSVWGAGGLSTLYYKPPTFAKKTEGFGGNFGFGYTRYFSPNFGLLIGVEAALYNAKFSLRDTLRDAYDTNDKHNGEKINYRSKFGRYAEQQQLINVNIPLMLQFQAGDNHKFFAAAGFKLGLPVWTNYEISDCEFVAEGYYYSTKQTLKHQYDWGYGKFPNENKKKFDVDLAYMGSLELGVKWALGNPKYSLYTGIYADYTFNNVLKTNTKNFLDYSATAEKDNVVLNSVLNSQYTNNNKTQSFADKMQPVAVGLKIRLGINTCGNCVDSDGDGVCDSKDLCPGTPPGAPVDKNGCPLDSDKDGVPDYLDKCPNTPIGVAVDKDGCPLDTDGDGVPDYKDECPGTPKEARGFVDEKGCPLDTDGDGVYDYKDECPGTPKEAYGKVDEKGCPIDTDGDGVPDYKDECPGTPKEARGFVDEKGCPLDTDGDGVYDYEDRCIKVPGVRENFGCPALKDKEKQVFERAMRGINFETAKDIIRPESFGILNEVVKIMAENPNYNLEINGHTDNVGKPDMNLDLSQRRAASVKRYLVSNGISENRLTTAGFGDTRPIMPNTTAENKALNRRVEFIVKYKE